ncbi:MAG: sigma-70 family RNA polymerase sigma factor [Planctomycetota bacterium]
MPLEHRTDAELLAAHAAGGPEAVPVFEEMVRRHGGAVHRTCQRVLEDASAAEDAAQAVFIVLARKSGVVRGNLAAYLHRVAVNAALCVRREEVRRKQKEQEAAAMNVCARDAGNESVWDDVRPHLDAAVERLPAGERAAVVMHYLEGRPQIEVARLLGVPEGTVNGRVRQALVRLRGMLARRGIVLSVAGLAGLLAERAAEAACPAFLLAAGGNLALAGTRASGLAIVGAVGAQHAALLQLAEAIMKTMFWAKIKLAAAVVCAAAAVGTAVPVIHQAVGAAAKPEPEPAVQIPVVGPDNEEVLEFRRLEVKAPTRLVSDKPDFVVARSREAVLMQIADKLQFGYGVMKPAEARQEWTDSLKIDFQKEMVLAVFKGRVELAADCRVSRVKVEHGEVHVELEFRRLPQEQSQISRPFDLVVCLRRDLPVVFYENGKEVARVPFKPAEDKELGEFLKVVPGAWAAGVGTVTECTVKAPGEALPSNAPPASWPAGLWRECVAVEVERELYAGNKAYRQPLSISVWGKDQPQPRFKKGDKVIFCGGEHGSGAVLWSPEREKAVRVALAPGWQFTAARRVCPWCIGKPEYKFGNNMPAGSPPPSTCEACGRKDSRPAFPARLCAACAAGSGICMKCGSRRVGPATRRVEVLLGTKDPLRETRDIDPMKMTIPPGKAPELWVAARLAEGVKEVPELTCALGKDMFWHTDLFLLITGPDGSGQPIFAPERLEAGTPKRLPLAGSTTQQTPQGMFPGTAFAHPGVYTVRAVAGRLISNPVTVVVENSP